MCGPQSSRLLPDCSRWHLSPQTLLAINGVALPPKKSLHASQSLDLPSGVHTVLADFTPGVSCQDRGLPTIASAAAA